MAEPARRPDPARRPSLGALFLVLAAIFVGITVAAVDARRWIVAVGAAAIALWMLSNTVRAFGRR